MKPSWSRRIEHLTEARLCTSTMGMLNCWRSLFHSSRTWNSVTNNLLEWMEIRSESIRNTSKFSYHLMYRCRRYQTRNADLEGGKEWVFCGAKYFIPDWDTALISCVMIICWSLKKVLPNDSLVSTQNSKKHGRWSNKNYSLSLMFFMKELAMIVESYACCMHPN